MTNPLIDLNTRDKMIWVSIDAINTLSSRYEQGELDTLGFFDELGKWTRATTDMLNAAVHAKAAQEFNSFALIEEKKNYLEKQINQDRKKVFLA